MSNDMTKEEKRLMRMRKADLVHLITQKDSEIEQLKQRSTQPTTQRTVQPPQDTREEWCGGTLLKVYKNDRGRGFLWVSPGGRKFYVFKNWGRTQDDLPYVKQKQGDIIPLRDARPVLNGMLEKDSRFSE